MTSDDVLVCVDEECKVAELQFLSNINAKVTILSNNPNILTQIENVSFKKVFFIKNDTKLVNVNFSNISKVIIFGERFSVIYHYVTTMKMIMKAPIIVVTKNNQYPNNLLLQLGAKVVIYSHSPSICQIIV